MLPASAPNCAKAPRAWQTPESRLEVKHLWDKYRALQSHYRTHRTLRLQHRDRGLLAYALEAFRRHAAFRKCQTTLKQRGKARRKAIIDEVLQEAAKAASAGDMHALYSHIRRIAPKTSRERIQIRGPDNEILAPQKEYEHIYQYFSKLYSQGPCNRDVEYQLQQDYAITDAEILSSLKQQTSGKAVPRGKVPPDVWKRCAGILLPYI